MLPLCLMLEAEKDELIMHCHQVRVRPINFIADIVSSGLTVLNPDTISYYIL